MIEGDVVFEIIRRAHTRLPADVLLAIERAQRAEKEPVPKLQLQNILENVKVASTRGIPMCQDTGIPVFFVFGNSLDMRETDKTIGAAYKLAEQDIPLRPNMVDPLTREQVSNGIQIYYHYSINTVLHYLPKGSGSENMSCSGVVLPESGEQGIIDFILEIVKAAGGNPCPPIILGIGIGGTLDHASYLAKKSLLKPIGKNTELEEKITAEVNNLGIGPMGLGGSTTCLGTNIETFPCHTASLPIAVNIQCWAHRHAGAKIGESIEYL